MNRKMYLLAGALLLAFGLSGNASASTCLYDNATFAGSIGSTSSCADYNNMAGCVIGSGESSCTYVGTSGCTFTVTAAAPVGSTEPTSYSISGDCDVKMAITQGNQGANYCQYFYPNGVAGDTLTTLGNKGEPVSHKQLEICTDQVAVTLSSPVVTLDKKVVRVVDGEYDCADASEEISVIANVDPATLVAYCYTISNKGEGALELPIITDDNGTPDDVSDDFDVYCVDEAQAPLNSLPGGESCEASIVVGITNAGERVNTAIASGTFDGGTCENCWDSDIATVNAAVVCDADTQAEADATGTVVERRGLEGTTRCGPKTESVQSGVGLLCDGSCQIKPECDASNTSLPASCVQPCKPSGNWNTYGVGGIFINNATPSPGNLPLCQEVLTNPYNSDDPINVTNPSLVRSDGHSSAYRRNPLLYYFPASGGGNSVGTIYCILYPGETAGVCPSGSIVY